MNNSRCGCEPADLRSNSALQTAILNTDVPIASSLVGCVVFSGRAKELTLRNWSVKRNGRAGSKSADLEAVFDFNSVSTGRLTRLRFFFFSTFYISVRQLGKILNGKFVNGLQPTITRAWPWWRSKHRG